MCRYRRKDVATVEGVAHLRPPIGGIGERDDLGVLPDVKHRRQHAVVGRDEQVLACPDGQSTALRTHAGVHHH